MQTVEIIDAHVHAWNPDQISLPWLAKLPQLHRVMDFAEYDQQTLDLPVGGIVYVEVGVPPEDALLEAQQIVAIGKQYPRLLGMVAAAPLEYGDRVRVHLEALQTLGPLIKGVRRNRQDEHPHFCLQPAFIQGVQCLTAYGMTCDLSIRHTPSGDYQARAAMPSGDIYPRSSWQT